MVRHEAKAERKKFYPIVLVILWICMTVLAFWWFQFRHISRFDEHFAAFNGSDMQSAHIPGLKDLPLVVHFVDETCACSRFAEPHIEDLETQFRGLAEFVRWTAQDPRLMNLNQIDIPAGPAVAIWNLDGELAYFGPYSSGYFCGEGDDFVKATLNKLNIGNNPKWINHDVLGCFCPWNVAKKG